MMKYFFVFLFSIVLILPVSAQQKNIQSVEKVVELLRKAMVSGNADSLAMLTADELSYGHSSGLIEGKQAFIDKLASGKSDFISITLSNQTIVRSGKMALVRHQLVASVNDSGKAETLRLKVLLVFQFIKGKWLLYARQAVKA